MMDLNSDQVAGLVATWLDEVTSDQTTVLP
jgi:hypothetical protein